MSGFHTIEEAIYELMQGNIIIVVDDEDASLGHQVGLSSQPPSAAAPASAQVKIS